VWSPPRRLVVSRERDGTETRVQHLPLPQSIDKDPVTVTLLSILTPKVAPQEAKLAPWHVGLDPGVHSLQVPEESQGVLLLGKGDAYPARTLLGKRAPIQVPSKIRLMLVTDVRPPCVTRRYTVHGLRLFKTKIIMVQDIAVRSELILIIGKQ
jgi:hypothetical protein